MCRKLERDRHAEMSRKARGEDTFIDIHPESSHFINMFHFFKILVMIENMNIAKS